MRQAGKRGKKASATVLARIAGLLYLLTRRANKGLDETCTGDTNPVSLGVASKLFESSSKLGSKRLQ